MSSCWFKNLGKSPWKLVHEFADSYIQKLILWTGPSYTKLRWSRSISGISEHGCRYFFDLFSNLKMHLCSPWTSSWSTCSHLQLICAFGSRMLKAMRIGTDSSKSLWMAQNMDAWWRLASIFSRLILIWAISSSCWSSSSLALLPMANGRGINLPATQGSSNSGGFVPGRHCDASAP